MAGKSRNAARSSHGERREEILAQALRLFSEHGVQQVSTRQIASAVGISQPSLYAHFRTSQEIAQELCVRAFRHLAEDLSRALAGEGGRAERLRRAALAYVSFGLDNPDAYRVAFMIEKLVDHRAQAEQGPGLAAGLEAYKLLRGGISGADGTADLIAQSVWATLHGLVSLLIARPHFPWVDKAALIDAHVTRALAGLD
ncbi:TetR family transcriptional regulator [Sphingomonas oleivorans]|uniref:TetR family transcriptional regulator n=1 Tax=Sphingomonas oleivorans TaxID=1735121 RepID=A0A2T5G299_9SPHN|nr:TetR/AcrR family transcriptional regulator [Sphingomonas oleivorans]PTQ13277.1 TetR family transcriptional regulator [Sphingomonas oleivorans]